MTKTEATNVLKQFIKTYIKSHGEEDTITVYLDNVDVEALSIAVKELEKDCILDKVKAKIEALPKTYPFMNHFETYVKENDVRRIIDKYKESEVN